MSGNNPQSNANRFQAALARWHNVHKDSGNPQDDLRALDEQIDSHQNIKAFLNSLGKGTVVDSAVADALIAKWKSDPKFLDNLDKNLGEDGVAQQLREGLKDPKNTQALITVINTVGQEDPPAPVAAGGAATVSAAASALSAGAGGGGTGIPPPTTDQQATVRQQGGAAGTHHRGTTATGGNQGTKAPQPDAGSAGQKNLVMEAVEKLAHKAKELGIDQATIDGFVETVRKGTGPGGLQEKIYRNLKDNPQLVTAVNGLGEMDVNKLGYFKTTVKVQFVDLLNDPNKLADPAYAKFLVSVAPRSPSAPGGQQSGAGRSAGTGDFSNFGAGLQGAFSKIGELFSEENLGRLKEMLMGLLNQLWDALKSLFGNGGIFSMTGGPREDGPRMSAHVAPAGSKPPTAVDPNTGTVTGGPRVDGLGPQHRRLPGAGAEAAPGGVNGPTRVA